MDEIINQLNARMFYIVRNGDESGVSGTGRVLDGIVWPNGWVNVFWRTDLDPVMRGKSSFTFFDSFTAFMDIHINSHPSNNTEVVWMDEEVGSLKKELEELKKKFANKSEKLKEANKELRELKENCEEPSKDESSEEK